MAPSLGRKNLVCFYCNTRSPIKYDGLMTIWECQSCQSLNYLDENGEITDPPVATEYEAPKDRKYAIVRPDSTLAQRSDSTLFCSTCLKNQHLYTSSLAQYHIETDPKHPQYKELERRSIDYRKSLERRYPQVCEDCEPQVLERMKEAGKAAKTDYLRRLMDKSRARRSGGVINRTSFSQCLQFGGKVLWYAGLAGQLLWNIMALVGTTQYDSPLARQISLPPIVVALLSKMSELALSISTSRTWASSSLVCSAAVIWWNPMFKQMNDGFINHITGFADWYKYQVILLVARGLFYYIIGTGVMADQYSMASRAAHMFIFGFVIYVATAARRSLKVDMSPLWASTPQRLPHVGPRSKSPNQDANSMADILDQIAASPSHGLRQSSPLSPLATYKSHQQQMPGKTFETLSPTQLAKPSSLFFNQRKSNPSLMEMSQNEPGHYLSNEEISAQLKQEKNDGNLEEMEWTPSQAQSQYRAFDPANSLQRSTQLFGQAPTVPESSPFWFKLPPAPITPAHRLRNPPNQPRLRVSSQEVKNSFFNNVTRRGSTLGQPDEGTSSRGTLGSSQEIEFAPQKFFPAPPNESANDLEDLFTSFTLEPAEKSISPKPNADNSRSRHTFQGLVLLVGLVFWNQALQKPSDYSRNVALMVMFGCTCVGSRTILDNTIFSAAANKYVAAYSLGACLGGLEVAASGYGILEILAGRGNCGNSASLGAILVGGMMIQEMWFALFQM